MLYFDDIINYDIEYFTLQYKRRHERPLTKSLHILFLVCPCSLELIDLLIPLHEDVIDEELCGLFVPALLVIANCCSELSDDIFCLYANNWKKY